MNRIIQACAVAVIAGMIGGGAFAQGPVLPTCNNKECFTAANPGAVALAPSASTAVVVNWPATIAGSGTFTSSALSAEPPAGRSFFACATSTQTGTLSVQRYADAAATIAIGAAVSQAMSAATNACVAVNDGMLYLSARVSIVNGSGSTATISGTAAGQGV